LTVVVVTPGGVAPTSTMSGVIVYDHVMRSRISGWPGWSITRNNCVWYAVWPDAVSSIWPGWSDAHSFVGSSFGSFGGQFTTCVVNGVVFKMSTQRVYGSVERQFVLSSATTLPSLFP
jgi:hypothetical protein